VRSATGAESEVDFLSDELIILAGDGFNQYINDKHSGLPVYAPAHAFRMPERAQGLHRIWFGMMQLPPADAVLHIGGPTFAQLRERTVEELSASAVPLTLGCSGNLLARELMADCGENQIYCWHRCYNFTADLSPDACAAKDLEYKCVDQFDQIYRPENGHGDYNPACTNSTSFVTPRPLVEQPTGECDGFTGAINDPAYTHKVELVSGSTYLLWTVVGDEIAARMLHKGLVGWMAVGAANVGGEHNGMNGASIVMGQNNLVSGMTINEHKIHESMTAFRHWKTPLSPPQFKHGTMEATGCYSTLSFQTKAIGEVTLNMTGTNQMLWAISILAHPTTEYGGYAPYHGIEGGEPEHFRGRFEVDFSASADKASAGNAEASSSGRSSIATAVVSSAVSLAFAAAAASAF
jgi:hypothetical protein